MEDKFSVCICVYHKDDPNFFIHAIKSIYSFQTVKPSEIVIVVDGPVPEQLEQV